MADFEPIHPITQLTLPDQGLSQDQRLLKALMADYILIDERDEEELFTFLKAMSERLRFYSEDDQNADASWQAFFPFEAGKANSWIESRQGHVEPHLALLKVFLEAYQQGPQAKLNQLKQRYLNYYYQDVLRFQKKATIPARAHLVVSLKKQVSKLPIGPEHLLLAGKREDKSDIVVTPRDESLINQSRIIEKCSVFRSNNDPDVIRMAMVADSVDGLGQEFGSNQRKWYGFGHESLPKSQIGFAISSNLLWLGESERQIQLLVTVTTSLTKDRIEIPDLFRIHLSTLNGWSQAYLANATIEANTLSLSLTLPTEEAAIVGYQSQLHGYQLDTTEPVMQLLINNDLSHPLISRLSSAKLADAKLSVSAMGVRTMDISSDSGRVNPDNDFLPFGPTPKVGSSLSIRSDEIFSKRLKQISINLSWKSPPVRLADHYAGYCDYVGMPTGLNNDFFRVDADLIDGDGRSFTATEQPLFHPTNAGVGRTIQVSEDSAATSTSPNQKGYAQTLSEYRSIWAKKQLNAIQQVNPVYRSINNSTKALTSDFTTSQMATPSPQRKAQLRLTLKQDFFHQAYRNAYVKNVLALNADPDADLPVIAEPYTPTIADMTIDYEAYSQTVSFTDRSPQAFTDTEIGFFHLDCFGQRREHAYQRQQLEFVTDKQVSLLPEHQEEGALLLGLEKLQAGDSVQLLFQVADGSADPSLPNQPIRWSVLCDNYWKPLRDQELIYDRTNGLLTSGIVKLLIPAEATTENTLMPTGLLWLKLSVDQHPHALCQLRDVFSNAIEVVAQTQVHSDGTLSPYFDSLPASTINRFQNARTEVNSITQPFDGFGGRDRETDQRFAARASERLRHRDRALTIHDFETLVLQQFEGIYRVKTIPHTLPHNVPSEAINWQAPGHTTVLLVPYVNNHNAEDPRRPLTDSQTLAQVQQFLAARSSMQAKIHVINPRYLQVRVSLVVRFHTGYEFNFYREQLQLAIRDQLSPWITSDHKGPEFGGRIDKSVLMDFIEELPYVDFISEVRLQTSTDGISYSQDQHQVEPENPLQILTSATSHQIEEMIHE